MTNPIIRVFQGYESDTRDMFQLVSQPGCPHGPPARLCGLQRRQPELPGMQVRRPPSPSAHRDTPNGWAELTLAGDVASDGEGYIGASPQHSTRWLGTSPEPEQALVTSADQEAGKCV
jgi:hypothetical protein